MTFLLENSQHDDQDWHAMGLPDHSPFAILQQIRQAPFVKPEKRIYTAAEKKQKQRERNRIFMAKKRLQEKATRVNLFSDSGTANQRRADNDKSRAIQASSNRYRTA